MIAVILNPKPNTDHADDFTTQRSSLCCQTAVINNSDAWALLGQVYMQSGLMKPS